MWAAVQQLVERAPDEAALCHHGLHLLAAARQATDGKAVSRPFQRERRAMAARELVVPLALGAARDAYDGRLLLVKGPEAARCWPAPATRPYRDLDLIADDAGLAHAAFKAAGFVETGRPELYVGIHHLRPLYLPGLPFTLEIHSRPKWPAGLPGPDTADLFSRAVEGSTGVDGILALPPAEHAVLLAAHAWAHRPLGRLSQLVDVAAVARETDRAELRAVSRRWRCGRLWRTTSDACDCLLAAGPRPAPLRTWARHLEGARERTVRAEHLQRWMAAFWGLPVPGAVSACAAAIATDLRPWQEEGWASKLMRARSALDDAALAKSEHDLRIEAQPRQALASTPSEGIP